jgi:Na+(H+)/acetate symporter ActP
MQFFILLLGAFVFVFYQFERPPVFFNQAAWQRAAAHDSSGKLQALENDFATAHAEKKTQIDTWLAAERAGEAAQAETARNAARSAQARIEQIRKDAKAALVAADPAAPTNDADYVFITFILQHLPHGMIGLLVTVFFAAALNSKAAELNALGSSTTVDFYRPIRGAKASDAECVRATRWFTALWGLVAIGFALFAHLSENLIQASNILGSIFYGVMLGLFLVAFFLKNIRGSAVFFGALAAQALVFVLYATLTISYLWYNVIGCVACMAFAALLQAVLKRA